ncbi:hypothetical protein SDC9_110084 [bioreactor metagenome]|uniref:Uncharacterized protein n=1 Tax=bioreactor metagenome TaxID=1076179 RepID=A0A645BN35_9ZZZZ
MSKRSVGITLFIVLIIAILSISCSIVPQAVKNLFATPTPTSTSTPTPTPLPPIDIKSCSEDLGCADAIKIEEFFGAYPASGEDNYVEIPFDQPVLISEEWYAVDEETLLKNKTQIEWVFTIDGQNFFQEKFLSRSTVTDYLNPDLVYPSEVLSIVLYDWQLNQPHTVTLGYRVHGDMNTGDMELTDGYEEMQTWLIKPVFIPTATLTPTSTNTPTPTPTNTPEPVVYSSPTPACQVSSSIEIENSTGGSLTLNLYGPSDFYFYLGSGITTLEICPGSYDYEAWGCGNAYDSGTINSGESHEFYCY